MDIAWTELLTVLGVSGATAGVLSKLLVSHWLNKDLEKHKSKLNKTVEHELIRLRAEVDVVASAERHARVTLHSKQFDVVCDLYARLVEAQAQLHSLTRRFQGDNEEPVEQKAQRVAQAWDEFLNAFRQSRILFSSEVCERVDQLLWVYTRGFSQYTSYQRWWHTTVEAIQKRDWDARDDAEEYLRENVPAVVEQLERDFRTLLRVEAPVQADPEDRAPEA